ncbi:MAG: hypothetical protein HYY84_09230 [Deltaproteobacteria bacterium]|nr:hypothetical protein [Deltaproteobacteria bacterium]
MQEKNETQTAANSTKPGPVPAELTETFSVLHKRYVPYADKAALIERGSRVATLDVTAAARNFVAEVERYPDFAKELARFGFPAPDRQQFFDAAMHLEVAYHKSEGATVDVTLASAKVGDLVKEAKLHRAELTTIADNALPTVLADSVRRAAAAGGRRPIDVAKALGGVVAALRGVPATWDGPDGVKVDLAGRLKAFGLGEETLARAGAVAEALQKAASERDRTRVEAQGQANGPWDVYDGILWEVGKVFGRAATTVARVSGRADLRFSMTDEIRRIAGARRPKGHGAAADGNRTAPAAGGGPVSPVTPGSSGPR